MKYSKKKVQECVSYVEQNGLMQRFGSTLKDFCTAMNITQETYYQWMQKSEFSESLEKAKEVFDSSITVEAEKSLAKLVRGFKTTKLEEFGEIDKTTKKFSTKKAKRTTVDVKPDVGACIFVLTNQAPEKWQNRQNNDVTLRNEEGKRMTLEEINAEIARLDKLESPAQSESENSENVESEKQNSEQ